MNKKVIRTEAYVAEQDTPKEIFHFAIGKGANQPIRSRLIFVFRLLKAFFDPPVRDSEQVD